MIDPRSLRGQLALAYAAALLVALIAFGAATLALVDRTQRIALDDRLQTALRAVAAIVEVRGSRLVLDDTDRSQLSRIAGTSLDAAIVERAGTPVASSGEVPPQVLALVRAHPAASVTTVESANGPLRVELEPIPAGRPIGTAVAWREIGDVLEVDRRLAILLALAIPVVAAFAVFAGSVVAARGLRPLNALATIASEIEAHDLSGRLAIPPRDDELGRLCATFDRMLDRLEAAFARERRFTSDASHELRAPLSVIRAEADLALRRARDPDQYEHALRSIAAQADYLEAVTRDLLAAARAQTSVSTATADLGEAVRAVARRLAPLARERGVAIDIAVDGRAAVHGDANALGRAAGCLVHNALKYARAAVDVRVERTGGTMRLLVGDDGPGFSQTALAHATERFWRDDPARSPAADDGGTGGAGLGLAIAAAVVHAAGGTLELNNRPDGGALAIVELPPAPPTEA